MPKKTLALITGLVVVTIILFVIALNSSKPTLPPPPPPPPSADIEELSMQTGIGMDPAKSVLTLSPNPLSVAPGQQGSAIVQIDTSGNEVTAVQLEIAYDPNVISNVQIRPGDLFANPVVLINKNSTEEGRYTYAYGIMPNQTPVQGAGQAAIITFTAKNVPGERSQLALLPSTLVTARGVSESVLKLATGTIIEINQSGFDIDD